MVLGLVSYMVFGLISQTESPTLIDAIYFSAK